MQIKMKLNGGNWGGLRNKAGRKRIHSAGVAHQKRQKVSERTPLHVNFKYSIHLRNKQTLKLLKRAIQNARSHGLKVLHYSFQSNHIHLIIEAIDNKILTKGMRSLTITFAKGIKKGSIQIQRYHLHVLKTVKEVKHALYYVLFNQQRHESGTCHISEVNEYSSLLCMKESLMLIQKFAKEKTMMIKVEKEMSWRPDGGSSYVFSKAVKALTDFN